MYVCSYAARESPEYNPYRKSSSKSRSRSTSPVNTGQITYITSFGDEEEAHSSTSHNTCLNSKRINYSLLKKRRSESPVFTERMVNRRTSRSRSNSRSRHYNYYKFYDRKQNSSRNRYVIIDFKIFFNFHKTHYVGTGTC